MEQPVIQEKLVEGAVIQFIFPFSLKIGSGSSLISTLIQQSFDRFRLDDLNLQNRYYGSFSVSHHKIEHHFLPFSGKILFPRTESRKGFQRFSKPFNLSCSLKNELYTIPFTLLSADVILCPYELGFLTVRTEIKKSSSVTLSEAIEFAQRFKILENAIDNRAVIQCGEGHFEQTEHFLFKFLIPGISSFFDTKGTDNAYFETLPFFEDERMYVQALFNVPSTETIDQTDVYRVGKMDGLDREGHPYISANNLVYIDRFLEKYSYDRWAPKTYYILEGHGFFCLTKETKEVLPKLVSHMCGEYYYGLLLNLFHKIALLKLSNAYSEVNVDHDSGKIEELIYSINTFMSHYYFVELATHTQGSELFLHLRKMFKVEELYDDVRETLFSLYRYKETFSSKRNSSLLLILTLFTVVSGIYGMNQVIEDLKGNIDWEKMQSYSIFEYIALFVTLSGLTVSASLVIHSFWKWRRDRNRRKRWEP